MAWVPSEGAVNGSKYRYFDEQAVLPERGVDPNSGKASTTARLPDFSHYEAMAQQPLRRGQLAPIAVWVRGEVLDVGANFGRFSALSSSTVSLDIEKRWLLRGIELNNIKRAVVGSALSLPFGTGLFDTVLAIGIAEHIPMFLMPRFLDELTRVTKPSGRLVVQVSSPYALFSLLRMSTWSDLLHPYSPFRLRKAMLKRGWRQVAWLSSGLLGLTHVMPQTVNAPIPWARTFCHVFAHG